MKRNKKPTIQSLAKEIQAKRRKQNEDNKKARTEIRDKIKEAVRKKLGLGDNHSITFHGGMYVYISCNLDEMSEVSELRNKFHRLSPPVSDSMNDCMEEARKILKKDVDIMDHPKVLRAILEVERELKHEK